MDEIWKNITGYDGLYQVSNKGRVRSFQKGKNGAILKHHVARGYAFIGLWNPEEHKSNNLLVHRLVAKEFIPNPNAYDEVNHKDENKLNNSVENLEWCTRSYNMAYKNARFRQGLSYSKPVEQLTLDNIPIAVYYAVSIAAKINNIDSSSILKCCKNKRETVGGYRWRYVSE